MSDSTLGRYFSLNKSGIDPRFFPEESFYYYNLPDYDTGDKVALSQGKSIDSNKLLVHRESLLISKLNPRIKRVWLVRNDGCFRSISSTEFVNLIPNDNTNVDYLFFFLQQDWLFKQLEAEAVGTTNSHVRFKPDLLCRISGELPPIPQQRKIARILATIDNLIEKTESLIAKYQAIKQGMMHDLFTRGVDKHGHLRPPHEEAPELYKQSEMGWIPMEWDCITLSEVVPIAQYGISVSLDDSEGIPVLRMNNLGNGVVDVSDIKRSIHPEARRLLLKDGDVLFNRTNSIEHVGRTSIWKNELPEASFASYLVRLVPNTGRLMPEYLVYWMNRREAQIAIRQFATPGVHQVNINPTNLRKSLILVPSSLREQAAITKIIQQQEKQVSMEQFLLAKLSSQKIGLMQDLLTGKVRVQLDEAEEAATHA